MGCAASAADGAELRRRGWARAGEPGHSEASTSGLLAPPHQQEGQEAESSSGGRRRGCKVAPEPKELEEGTAALPSMPGSPSFRYYCQKKTAAVDRIVADAIDADDTVRIRATARQLSNRSEITANKAQDSNEVSQPKGGTKWLRFSGLSIVAAAWHKHNLFSRQRSKPSPPPAAASDASSQP
ncbi:uncharacterized protein LOC103650821 [Zea mays]|uniref:Uncharacterized protein n=1 Tax=Zea mays TaxID=4577 RepID=A0A1D6N2M0_MAIZE|nr:uncharacterized protein LOC103650821 [Zea mays]ONM34960.1 hypothetical protein ZEAMMB73_Zm00001d042286 [Zea mays]|eukprot:NP_001333685.1 uncharacterized protein LOC103650821 [Zea mays]